MYIFDKITQLYYGFHNISNILRNMIQLNTITLEDLNNTIVLNKLKQNIMSSGCIGIKFTQWYISHCLSNTDTRSEKLCSVFEDIFDQCPQHSLEHTRSLFEQDFGAKLEDLFDMRLFKPLASGSIGQVYHTRMKDTNLDVVVKVKHPDVDNNILQYTPYLKLIKKLQSIKCTRNWLKLYFDIEDFIQNVNQQVDFKNEVINVNLFRENFSNNDLVIIPAIYMYSSNIIISKYEDGVEISELSQYQRYKTILNLICFIEQMLLTDDFIHGDLHIKNWKVRIDNGLLKIIIYDCGICFSTGDLNFNRVAFNSFNDSNIIELTRVINTMLIGDITPQVKDNITEFTDSICTHYKHNKLDISHFLNDLMKFLYENHLTLNKICLNLMITVSVVEHIFKNNNLLSYRNGVMLENTEMLHHQRMELINLCEVYNCYPKLKAYLIELENIQNKTETETEHKNITLFGNISSSAMTFTPIDD
jgi:predicted unusual protein kinase regulating ubiquinone biosynthesis (AarF/ABC1/UbiB family)